MFPFCNGAGLKIQLHVNSRDHRCSIFILTERIPHLRKQAPRRQAAYPRNRPDLPSIFPVHKGGCCVRMQQSSAGTDAVHAHLVLLPAMFQAREAGYYVEIQ
jgi:hypothetical protein